MLSISQNWRCNLVIWGGGILLTENSRSLPSRQEIADELKWRLEDMYPTDQEWEEDFRWVRDRLPELGTFRGKLGESGDVLLECLQLQDTLSQRIEKLFVYAHMRKDEDNTNDTYQALLDRAESLSIQYGSQASFIEPEILSIPEAKLQEFVQNTEGLQLYRHYLDEINRMREHTLSVEQEWLLAEAAEMGQAPGNIFSMFNDADVTFPVIKDENGEEVELTKGRFVKFLESPDRRVRRDAFLALYQVYGSWRNTLAATLSANVKRAAFFARVRKYQSTLEAALDGDNVPVEVYDNLIDTVLKNLPAMHKYVRLRKRALGLDELHMYDLYTPIVSDVKMQIPYDETKRIVLEALKPLGEDYCRTVAEAFSSGWIDVMENRGKTSGAYSWGAYGTHPYILLNYQNSVDSLFTVAHEMGHAMHSYYSDAAQPYRYAQYSIFVAEVASTVNEVLLIHYLLENTSDQKQRQYLINHYLEQFRGTLYRQTMFAEFEKIIHGKVWSGEPLTPEGLCQVYHELNERYYGPDIIVDPEIDMEWARIPHFYTPFYVYKYATGFSAAVALATRILQEGEPAVGLYINFLKAGSSDYPLNILREAGVDMRVPAPIQSALRVFDQLVDELNALI